MLIGNGRRLNLRLVAVLVAIMSINSSGLIVAEPTDAESAPAFFETVDLFKAGEGGYRTYRIPAIAISRQGTVIVACAARFDGHSDWANIDTMFRRSSDGGRTWSEQEVLTDDGRNVVDNATFIVDPSSDTIQLMYQINYARAYLKTSSDEGATWSAPREITAVFDTFRERDRYEWEVLAMGPGHGIVLDSGRFVVPVWLATDHSHRPSISATIYSDDRGATWHAGDVIAKDSDLTPNPSEHVLVQLADGRVMSNLRCESRKFRRAVSFSPNGATNWTKAALDDQLFDPICMASMIRLRGGPGLPGPDRILFANPDSSHVGGAVPKSGGRERRNVTVRLSRDGGQTWPLARVIEPGPSGYSDLAAANDGTIFLLYERASVAEQAGKFIPGYITLARFNRAWLTSEQPPAVGN